MVFGRSTQGYPRAAHLNTRRRPLFGQVYVLNATTHLAVIFRLDMKRLLLRKQHTHRPRHEGSLFLHFCGWTTALIAFGKSVSGGFLTPGYSPSPAVTSYSLLFAAPPPHITSVTLLRDGTSTGGSEARLNRFGTSRPWLYTLARSVSLAAIYQ